MANDNKPIWKDYPLYCGNGDYVIEELVNGTWQTRKRFHVLRTPYGGGEVAANDMLCADLKTGYPETTGVTTHSAAYRRYRCQTGSTASQTQVFNFCQDWSYDEWDGEARTLSAPINGHADMRQRLFRSRFGETEEEIEIREKVRPEITIEPRQIELNYDGRSAAITITSNVPYELSIDETWLYFTPQSGEPGTQVIYIGIDENKTFHNREAAIKMTYENYWQEGDETITACTIAQKAVVPSFSVAPMEQSVDWDFTGLTYFAVNTNVPFTASTDASWLSYSGMSQAGYHAYNVYFNTSANTEGYRMGSVSFTFQVDASGHTQTITPIVRQGEFPALVLIPQSKTINYSAQSMDIQIYSANNWHVVHGSEWLSGPVSGTSGTSTITITAEAYSGRTSRSGEVIFSNDAMEATFEVEQQFIDPKTMIWYLTKQNQEYIPRSTTGFGANIIEHTYDSVSGEGIIKFDGNVTNIPPQAFSWVYLSAITIPETVMTIGASGYSYNSNLTSITIPDSVQTISDGAFLAAFKEGTDVYVNVGKNVTSIGRFAIAVNTDVNHGSDYRLYLHLNWDSPAVYSGADPRVAANPKPKNNGYFKELHIGGTINSVPALGFSVCTADTITIDSSIASIGEAAFFNTICYSKVVIPGTVKTIGVSAFQRFTGDTGIEYGVETISDSGYAFSNVSTLSLPTSIRSIGNYAFRGSRLANLYYAGTMARWALVSKGTNWHLNAPVTVVHCSDGDVPI